MLLIILYGLLLLSLLYLYSYLFKTVKRKLPPGSTEAPIERGVPLLGVLRNIKPTMQDYLLNLGKQYGGIFRINLGMREVYVLNDYQALKMALKEDSDNFSGRWNGRFVQMTTRGCGILLVDGEVWAHQRSFMLKVLRDFGMGKSRTDNIVQHECLELLTFLQGHQGCDIDFSKLITIYTVNIIAGFLMKKRYSSTDEDINFLIGFMRRILSKPNPLQILHLLIPAWDNSEILSKIGFKLFFRSNDLNKINDMVSKEVEQHRRELNQAEEGEDFMDRYLIEQARIKNKDGLLGSFSDYQLTRSVFEMLAAGFDSTSTTLTWGLLFLAKYQDVQNIMHQEIVDLLDPSTLPATNDRKQLPYTEAVIDEVMRLSSVSPLAVFHRNFHDTVINGIFIPRNSFILPNLYGCHRDASVWERPYQFYPEHFLKESEDGALVYRPREELLPFSLGKRQCLGESLARAEIFIFLTSIIQKFKVTFAHYVTEDQYQDAVQGDSATIRYPKIKDFVFTAYISQAT